MWFEDGERDELLSAMEDYILSCGVHGSAMQASANRKAKSRNLFVYKIKKYIGSIFISRESMKKMYPILCDKPYLLLYYYGKRTIIKLFNGSAKEFYNKEVALKKEYDTDKLRTHVKLIIFGPFEAGIYKMAGDLRRRTISGLFWRFAERCGSQSISFVVSIILARILTPADYGLIGLITVFINISLVFAQSGLGNALVQRKNIDEVEFSTVFYFSLVFSIILYVGLWVFAPYIAGFYNDIRLVNIVRVLGVTVIIQHAYVQKTMQFRKFFISTLGGTILSAVIGIFMAYNNYGVWALVCQQIINQLSHVVIMWFTVRWRPKLVFSFKKMKILFSFGWKMLCSSLLGTVYNNVYSLTIGKFYSATDLGYYNRGSQFPNMIITNINTTIDNVLFPAMSEVQDERERLKSLTRHSIKTSTFFIFPAMAGLAAVAKPLTILLLKEKWLPAVPFIQFCCFTYAFWPIHTANLQAIKAVGRSDIFLGLEVIKKVIGIIVLIVTIPFGLYIMMIGKCFTAVLSSFINAYPNKKLLNYSYFEQVRDIIPNFVLSIFMCAVVLLVNFLNINLVLTIFIQFVLGCLVYFLGAKIFKFDSAEYILRVFRSIKK